MDTITHYLSHDHKRCDAMFIDAESFVNLGHWQDAEGRFAEFTEAMEQHFAMEEKILFLAFEKAIGSSAGPTAIMRNEHRQIRSILHMLEDAMQRRDANTFLGHCETLNIMLQQHNTKEESILYLMTDRALAGQKDEIIDAMKDIKALS